MKKNGFLKVMAALVLALLTAACESPSGPGTSGTAGIPQTIMYESKDTSGVIYSLTITRNTGGAAYSAKTGDSYEMVIIQLSGETRTSRGTVQSLNGDDLTLMPSGSGISFTVTISGGKLIFIKGEISCTGGETIPAPAGELIPINYSSNTSGNGTAAKPFIVDSAASLAKVGTGLNGWTLSAHYLQTSDITLNSASENNHVSIGAVRSTSNDNNGFTGSYDGGGFSITGLAVSTNSDDFETVGLFGRIGPGGTVENITLNNASITLNIPPERSRHGDCTVGGVAGLNKGTIKNCSVTGKISGYYTSCGYEIGISIGTGGIAGQNTGTVENCSNAGNIKSGGGTYTRKNPGIFCSLFTGGIAGSNGGTVADCSNYSAVNGSGPGSAGSDSFSIYAGGIVGVNGNERPRWEWESYSSVVTNSYNTGNIESTNTTRNAIIAGGGVAGYNYSERNDTAIVENCYSTGNINGNNTLGGIVGENEGVGGAVLRNCYSTGYITGTKTDNIWIYVGGVVGRNTDNSTHNCVALNRSLTNDLDYCCSRICGNDYFYDNSSMRDNRARADMLVNGKTVTSTDPASQDGADLAIGTALSAVFTGFPANIWTIPSGSLTIGGQLPTLKNVPGGTQNPRLPDTK
ncbi:MAG: hypothetical protein LBB81_10870 [Treponema sp.]|jgi:hypothetical protein|nr:hypothetical protein [Treponema sp.]